MFLRLYWTKKGTDEIDSGKRQRGERESEKRQKKVALRKFEGREAQNRKLVEDGASGGKRQTAPK